MASAIDDTKPVTGTPTTQSVRDNFAAAKSEITALQATVSGTLGYIAYFNSGTTISNSGIYQTGGNVGIGTTTPTVKLDVQTGSNRHLGIRNAAELGGGADAVLVECFTDGAAAVAPLNIEGVPLTLNGLGGGGGVVVGVPTGGNKGNGTLNAVTVYGNNVVLTSDQELKTEIVPLPASLPLVAAIEPRSFRWKPLPDIDGRPTMPPGFTETVNRGFLAQDVIKALGGKAEDGVDLGGMVAVLWQAVRELTDRVAELEGEKPAPRH